jgi:hypothetical protein
MIQRRYGIPKIWQDLICGGEVMDDRLALEDYDVFSSTPVSLVNAQRRLIRNRLLLVSTSIIFSVSFLFSSIHVLPALGDKIIANASSIRSSTSSLHSYSGSMCGSGFIISILISHINTKAMSSLIIRILLVSNVS